MTKRPASEVSADGLDDISSDQHVFPLVHEPQ